MTAVEFADGALDGRVVDAAASFKGIPYTAPPVDALRWREPQPAQPWAGVRDATAFGRDCVQVSGHPPARRGE